MYPQRSYLVMCTAARGAPSAATQDQGGSMTVIDTPTTTRLLSDELLARFDERAPQYDRENRFFSEDFAELQDAGYLNAVVARELGGQGLTFSELMAEQRRLA